MPVPTYRDRPASGPADVRGIGLDGAPLVLPVARTNSWTLLLFLSSRCDGCRELWEAFGRSDAGGMVTDETVAVVTRGPDTEDPTVLARLAPGRRAVVLSDEAWSAYRVQGPPFFVLVDGISDRVVTEGVAWGVRQVADHVRRSRAGEGGPEVPRLVPRDGP